MTIDKDIRKEYLIQYRNGLWTQIRAKEDSVWRFISFYAGAIILIVGFLKNENPSNISLAPISLLIMVMAIIIVSFWGILIVLDSNYWMQRNLIFIGNIEKDLLTQEDFGLILPKTFVQPSNFRYVNSYFIQIIFFSLTILIANLSFISISIKNIDTEFIGFLAISQFISITYCVLLTYTIYRNRNWVNEYGKVRQDAPGKAISDQERFDREANSLGTYWNSKVEDIFYIFSVLGPFSFIFCTIILQSKFNFFPFVGITLMIICFLLIVGGVVIRYLSNNQCKKVLHFVNDTTVANQNEMNIQKLRNSRSILNKIQTVTLFTCMLINIGVITAILVEKLPNILR